MQANQLFYNTQTMSCADVAEQLLRLATALEQGELDLDAHSLPLPATVTLNIAFAEQHRTNRTFAQPLNLELGCGIVWAVGSEAR